MYQTLYRKYRPLDFDSVVGQNPIVKTLQNSIIHRNFSHAYMFFGPRGTGKTTVSKIFARNINCLEPKDGKACGKCDHCQNSFSKDCIDIIEIDAASNNGVDEIRELRNKISLVPNKLNYKVYIIDEVHMLSLGAFNALLKTLEEPPEHAIFILATTDPQKVPETIVSRCQSFSFKKISPIVIQEKLKEICKEEKIKIDDEVLENIAILSDGGMRDALGLLDKLHSYTDQKISMEDFVEVNGLLSNQKVEEFISAILNGDITSVLNDMNEFDYSGKNMIQIFIQILNVSRNLILNYYLKHTKLEYSFDLLQKFANLINEKMFDIKRSDNTRIYIEMLLLKFMCDYTETSFEKTVETVEKPKKKENLKEKIEVKKEEEKPVEKEKEEKKKTSSKPKNTDTKIQKVLNIDEINKVRVNNTLAQANKDVLKEESEFFELLKDYTFDQQVGFLVCSLLDSKLRAASEDNIIISFDSLANVEQNLLLIEKLTEVYQKITKSDKNIAILSDDEWEKEKKEYIEKLKNNEKYEVLEEPEPVLEELSKDDIIPSSAMELFGDIVEIE